MIFSQNFLNGFLSRTDDALYALAGAIILQLVLLLVYALAKRPVMAMPALEMVCRPVAVFLNDKLNRGHRSDFSLIIRGLIVAFLLAGVIFALGIGVEYLSVIAGIGAWMDIVLLLLILSPVAALRPAYQLSFDKPHEGVYLRAAYALNRNLIHADIYGHRRSGYRLLALALGEWCLAPLFFYLAGGIPGAYVYVALSLFCRVAGHADTSRPFLSFLDPIWRIAGIVPSAAAIVTVALAALFAPGGRPLQVLKAFRYLLGDQAAEAAYAYAQNIVLGGAEQDRSGEGVRRPWIGRDNATAKLSHQDVIRGGILHCIALFLTIVGLFALDAFL